MVKLATNQEEKIIRAIRSGDKDGADKAYVEYADNMDSHGQKAKPPSYFGIKK